MSGITEDDKKYIASALSPLINEIRDLNDKQNRLSENINNMNDNQLIMQKNVNELNLIIKGNGNEGLIDLFKKHIKLHDDIENNKRTELEKRELKKRNNKALWVGLAIAFLGSTVLNSVVSYLLPDKKTQNTIQTNQP